MDIYSNNKYSDWKKIGADKGWITIFTPTYNRAKFLPRVFDCLNKQTDPHFVWIVVNDGSSDNTDHVMADLLDTEDFPILYISKPNGGKHSAFREAFLHTDTEFFVCMDDDDLYKENSVETFLALWSQVDDNSIGAIRTLVKKSDGTYASNVPVIEDGSIVDCDTLTRNYILNIKQENWTCYKTDSLRQINLFPTDYWMHDEHTFFSEGIWQGRFARKFKCRYVNVVLRSYTDDAEFSIIRSNKSRKHYVNMFINTKMVLDEQLDYLIYNIHDLFVDVILVSVLRYKLGVSVRKMFNNTPSLVLRLMYLFVIPFAWIPRHPRI